MMMNRLIVATILMLIPACSAHAQEPVRYSFDDVPAIMCEHDEICTLERLYRARGLDPIWFRGDRLNRQGRDVMEILAGARKHGIDPDIRYRLSEIEALTQPGEDTDSLADPAKALSKADFLLSAALYAYLSDLNGGDIGYERYEEIVDTGRFSRAVSQLAPKDRLYKKLTRLLDDLYDRADAGAAMHHDLNFGRRFLRPGKSHPSVPELRVRLEDLNIPVGERDEMADPFTYTPELVEAVKFFQARKGEKQDGVIGPDTLRLLNRGVDDEIKQVRLNLQRLRELRRDRREGKRVEVSIAEYMLHAYDDDDRVLSMPVIVGRPKRETVSFATEIRGVRFNPGWTVPDTIKKEDYLPKLREDPTYLQSQNIRILSDWSGEAEEVDPTTIDWEGMSEGELKAMRMFKPAGRSNPLGQIRVLMHNRYDIFIHDTNSKRLFDKTKRAYSSGCVRVSEPLTLTNFLFVGNNEGWSEDTTLAYLNKGRTRDILLEERIPVYLDYLSIWLDKNGEIVLGQDVYAKDKKEALSVDKLENRDYLRPLLHVNLFLDMINEPILEAGAPLSKRL